MMQRDEQYGNVPTSGSTVKLIAAYLFWFLTMLAGFSVCVIWHGALTHLYLALGGYKYGLTAYTYAVIFTLLLAWLILVVVSEGWYRHGAENGLLLRRVGTMLTALIALAAVGAVLGRVG